VFILPPSLNVLRKRLEARRTDTPLEIKKRLKLARKELSFLKNYDYAVINDSLTKATKKVESIIIAERCRVRK
jgi:guanylate kinase